MRLLVILLLILPTARLFSQDQSADLLQPLIIIDSLPTYNESMIINPSKFISLSTINPEKAMLLYGDNARYGVIKIQTLPDIRFARLEAILDAFKIESKYRSLKVYINKTPVKEPGKLLADLDEIKNVEIGPAQTLPATGEVPAQLYINIITQPSL